MHALKLTATALWLMFTAACSSGDEASAKDAASDTSGAASAQKAMARTQGTTPSNSAKSVEEGEGCPSLAPAERWAKRNVEGYDFNSAFCGDFTGDGQADALFVAYIPHGNSASHEIALFQNVNGALSYLRSVPDFFGEIKSARFNRGKIILDTAVMIPGDPRSTPSGRKSFEVDTATGKFVEGIASSSQTSATIARSSEATAGPGSGLMAKLPIKFGYYINDFESCSNPEYTVTKITPDGLWDIDPGNGQITETRLKSVARDEDRAGWYFLEFPDAPREEQDPSGIQFRPQGSDRIEMGIQDTGVMRFCRPEELPARLRK